MRDLWLWEDLDPTMHLACSSLNMRPILSTAHHIKYLHLSTHPHINITTSIFFFFFCFLYGKLFSCYLTNKTHSQDKHHIHLCSRGKLARKIKDKTFGEQIQEFYGNDQNTSIDGFHRNRALSVRIHLISS